MVNVNSETMFVAILSYIEPIKRTIVKLVKQIFMGLVLNFTLPHLVRADSAQSPSSPSSPSNSAWNARILHGILVQS
jgi:hypothetical protein